MAVLDEVKKMQQQGFSEQQIIATLRDNGASYKDISEALSQSQIKAAVEDREVLPVPTPISLDQQQPVTDLPEYTQYNQEEIAVPSPSEETQYPEYQPDYSNQAQYNQESQSYDYGAISPETITEISEQLVSEKMSSFRKQMESIIDSRTTIETKIESLEDRLKRIEKIIDILQSSVLRKVGDYGLNIADIKKELVETQKTFTKLVPELNKYSTKKKKKST